VIQAKLQHCLQKPFSVNLYVKTISIFVVFVPVYNKTGIVECLMFEIKIGQITIIFL